MKLDSVDKILDFAIRNEQDAADFYTGLADKMEREYTKKIFLDFAGEEKEHKDKLIAVKKGKLMLHAEERILDLKIGDYLLDVDMSPDLDYQEALILAMKAEKTAFKLYNDLASATDNAGLKETFLNLAQEEAKHKLRFEIEYDDYIYKGN